MTRSGRRAILLGWFVAASLAAASCELILPDVPDLVGGGGATTGQAQGGAGGGAGGAGVGGDQGTPPCCRGDLDGGCVGYVIEYAAEPDLTKACDDPAWSDKNKIVFAGADDGFPEKAYECRLSWAAISGHRKIFGCCAVEDDTHLTAEASKLGAPGAIFGDDGFEYIFSSARDFTSDSVAAILDVNGETWQEAKIDQASHSDPAPGYDPPSIMLDVDAMGASVNDSGPDHGYRMNWVAELPDPTNGKLYCQFALHDRTPPDAGSTSITGQVTACGGGDLDPTQWTICELAPPPQ